MVRLDRRSAAKKLTEFAAWWHGDRSGWDASQPNTLAHDIAKAGLKPPPELVAQAQAAKDFELWPENADAVLVYQRCGKLWRIDSMGGLLGLDRPGIESLMRMMLIKAKDRLALLDKLTIIEDEAMRIINGRLKKS